MQLVFDVVLNDRGEIIGFQSYDTNPAQPATFIDPAGSGNLINHNALLLYLEKTPGARDKAGLNVPTRLPLAEPGMTRWQAIVAQANGPNADASALALKLTA